MILITMPLQTLDCGYLNGHPPATYQHYRVARALDKFHREFGCETHANYSAYDLVLYVLSESSLLVQINNMVSSPGKVTIEYLLGEDVAIYDVDIQMCMETRENTEKLEKWREQAIGSGISVHMPSSFKTF